MFGNGIPWVCVCVCDSICCCRGTTIRQEPNRVGRWHDDGPRWSNVRANRMRGIVLRIFVARRFNVMTTVSPLLCDVPTWWVNLFAVAQMMMKLSTWCATTANPSEWWCVFCTYTCYVMKTTHSVRTCVFACTRDLFLQMIVNPTHSNTQATHKAVRRFQVIAFLCAHVRFLLLSWI